MTSDTVTVQVNVSRAREDGPPVPGLVVVYTAGKAVVRTIAVAATVELGRDKMPADTPIDPAMSRRHASVAFANDTWTVADLGSHNGSAIDGDALTGERSGDFRVLRLGQTVCLLERDIRPFIGISLASPDGAMTMGHRLHAVWRLLAQLTEQPSLHIHGESGSGKELAARAFHDRGPGAKGPFVAVNCAAIPATLAEAMLFGARKGAFSGADRDTEGLWVAADGGTLFLDEVGELDLGLQAKLLRVLETREVLAVGASKPRLVDVRVCSASHRDLKALVAQGRFREDLYFRVGRPEVVIPPLRERREEIPSLVCRAIAGLAPDPGSTPNTTEPALDATLVEAALLRPWPGNIRELLVEVRHAAQIARAESSARITAKHLGDAGTRPEIEADEPAEVANAEMPSREKILETLKQHGGKVASAARALGIARIRLRRWIDREGKGD